MENTVILLDQFSSIFSTTTEIAEEEWLAGISFDVLAGLLAECLVKLELDDEADEISVKMEKNSQYFYTLKPYYTG